MKLKKCLLWCINQKMHSTVHWYQDAFYLERKNPGPLKRLVLFISDQVLHLGIILSTYPLLKQIDFNESYKELLGFILKNYSFLEKLNNENFWVFVVLAISAYLFVIKGGTILTLLIIDMPNIKNESSGGLGSQRESGVYDYNSGFTEVTATSQEQSGNPKSSTYKDNYGRIIGVLERLCIVTAVLINKYEIIAVVVAVKSIGRFKEIDTKFSDYYIIGTLASYCIAFLTGSFLVTIYNILGIKHILS